MRRDRFRIGPGWRVVAWSFSAMAVAVVLVGTPADATHVTNHWRSAGYDTSAGQNYTGVQVYRHDRDINPGGTCNNQFTAPVVYQTQWVFLTADARNQIELGTMHKTGTCKFWFWGYTLDWVWHPVGTQGGVVAAPHTFRIVRNANGVNWSQVIDSTTMSSAISWATTGAYVAAGLETYRDMTITSHGYYSMRWNQGGTWNLFAGRDATLVEGSMCGRWISDTDWAAAENSTC